MVYRSPGPEMLYWAVIRPEPRLALLLSQCEVWRWWLLAILNCGGSWQCLTVLAPVNIVTVVTPANT